VGAVATEPLRLTLEFARAEQAGDPYGFRFAPQEYLLRSAGGGFASARLSWDQKLLADLTAVRLPGRDPEVVQRLGEQLRRFITAADWGEQELLLTAALSRQQRVVLCIRSAAAELYALPWELLTLKATSQHLGELPEVLLRYQWPETHAQPESPTRDADERILLAWSADGWEK
jgi:hypothetical protein